MPGFDVGGGVQGDEVWITGVGAVTGLGLTVNDTWQELIAGRCGIRRLHPDDIEFFDALCEFLGRVPLAAMVDHQGVKEALARKALRCPRLSAVLKRCGADGLSNMAVLSSLEAAESARLDADQIDSLRVGCLFGVSKPCFRALESVGKSFLRDRFDSDSTNVFAQTVLPDAAHRAVCQAANVQGPAWCPVAACATGLIAVIQAASLVSSGAVDVCFAGSADASATATAMAAFHRLGVLSHTADPLMGCRPFHRDRDGFQIGEGAATLVMESATHARARGAVPLARIVCGHWLTDATGLTQVDESGRVLNRLYEDLSLTSRRVDAVSFHGTGTIPNDRCEQSAIEQAVLQQLPREGVGRPLPAFAVKGALGHLLGAAGSVELAVSVLALQRQILPPTNGVDAIRDGASQVEIGLCRKAQNFDMQAILKQSLGFGGHVAACVIENVVA